MAELLRFETNKPEVVTMAFDDGKPVEGRYGDQFFYTWQDGQGSYLDPPVRAKIQKLGAKRGDAILLMKQEVRQGNRRSIDWVVDWAPEESSRPEDDFDTHVRESAQERPTPPQPAKSNGAGAPVARTATSQHTPSKTKLEDALKTVVEAVYAARQHAERIGFKEMPLFTAEDLRTMANTIMIQNGGGR